MSDWVVRPKTKGRAKPWAKKTPIEKIKAAIWLYFLLIIFEGALRKWVLPFLATPLLIVRDPIALWILITAYRNNLFPKVSYVIIMNMLGILGIITAVSMGHGNIMVALFGARIYMLHFPLMFVIGKVFTHKDVVDVGKITLWISIPMLVLIALQFYTPQSSWFNRSVGGGSEGGGFDGAMGFFRPPGTFSFTSGTTAFFSFAACYVFYFLLNPTLIKRWLLFGATAAVLASIPLSISRTLFFQIGVSGLFAFMAVIQKPKYLGKMMMAVGGGLIAVALLSTTSFFQTAMGAFFARFESASEFEGGLKGSLGDRFLGSLIESVFGNAKVPFWGYGLGMGTNVGSMLLSGAVVFLIAEGEWARIIGEMGPLLGIAIIVVRLALSVKLSLASYKKVRKGDLLPWLLLSFGVLNIAQGQWAPPNLLGFSTLIGGLIIASLKKERKEPVIIERKITQGTNHEDSSDWQL
ncbi:MAG: hypothetical protein QM726_03395 [Chitinophagaceae bacterium]